MENTEYTSLEELAQQLNHEVDHLRKNNPAPQSPDRFNRLLEQIGGLSPSGIPNYRVVWGQSETDFAYGQFRIKYPAFIAQLEETYAYQLHNFKTGKSKVVPATEKLPDSKDVLVVPLTRRESVDVGLYRWVLEMWIPPDEEENHDKRRYTTDENSGEVVDNLGPYPRQGVYKELLVIQTPDLKYRDLGDDVIEVVKFVIKSKEEYKRTVSKEKAIQNKKEEEIERRRKLHESYKEDLEKELIAVSHRLCGHRTFVSVPDNVPN